MEGFTSLLKKEHKGELILVILMVLYLVIGIKTPETVANMIDSLFGKIVIVVVVVYLFLNSNPILAVLSVLVAYELMRRSSMTTGTDALERYMPSEEKKMSQFTAFNQFPYTLEQEVVAKMAPIVRSGTTLTKASYKPHMDDLHDATSVTSSN